MAKKGFTLSEMLIVLVIIGILSAATAPLLSVKKKMKDFELSSVTCVRQELATDLNSTACQAAIKKAQYGQENAINTLAFFANNGRDTNEKTAASAVLSQACDKGGDKACNYFVKACQRDYSLCDTGGVYDLRHYLELMPGDSNNSEKFLMYNQAKPLYDSSNTNIRNAVDDNCCSNYNNINMACYINGYTECPWARNYGGAGEDNGYSLAVSGKYAYISGDEASSSFGSSDIFVLKLNLSDGTTVWKKHYGGTGYENGGSITVSGDYVYVTAGERTNTLGYDDILVMKLYAGDGTTNNASYPGWAKHYGGANSEDGTSIIVSGNYIYVAGDEASDTAGGIDIFLMQLDASGVVQWKKHYGGAQWDWAPQIVQSGSYIYVAGMEESDTAGDDDTLLMQLNASDGTCNWKKHYGSAKGESTSSILVAGSYIYITGSTPKYESNPDIFIIKTIAADGTPVWTKRYGGPGYEGISSMIISGSNLYLTGYAGNQLLVAQLNASDGSIVWKKSYGSGGPEGVEIAKSGNYLYILGYFWPEDALGYNPLVMKIYANQNTSNITDWTMNGTDMDLGYWTANGVSMGANWTVNGNPIKDNGGLPTSSWVTGGGFTTGGTGTSMAGGWTNAVDMSTSWDASYIKKGTDEEDYSTNYWFDGLRKDGLPIP